jgi:hypothetical protein
VKLDYLISRPFEKISFDGDVWGIVLEGGIAIWNLDNTRPVPDGLDGTSLTKIDTTEDEAVLTFGIGSDEIKTVALAVDGYSIGRKEWDEDEPPTTAEEAAAFLPPDPSTERVASGPQTPAQAIPAFAGGELPPDEEEAENGS